MNIADDFLAELGYELPATRTVLERVPDGKETFKPHPKSSALGHLAQLVARMPAMMTKIVTGVDLDLATGITHFVHHRALPLPQLYGPTADER